MADISKLLSDWSKAMANMDVTRSNEQLLNMMAGLKVPGLNMDALVASQRENLEALSTANRAALEGVKAVGEWQARLLQETMHELRAAIDAVGKSGSAHEIVAAETDLARKALEKAVGEMRELAEIVVKANQQATTAILQRIPASLNEIRDVLKVP
ncbi:MAG TPA: phasin family protein [Accumulibacter sp.]|nr:phasin family protein [Accumulibacter sp.]